MGMTPGFHRHELRSGLGSETLVRQGLMEELGETGRLRIAPDLNVIKLGGHGAIDYGRAVMGPLSTEIGELSRTDQLLVVTGGGARVRHIMDVGIDLGMPTGVLAELSGKISEQNATMVALLLSRWGGTRIHQDDLLELPTLLRLGQLPVIHGTPPYGLYEHPARVGAIPPHRTDTGAFLIAEVLGARSCILGKNVDGLYSADPDEASRRRADPEDPCRRGDRDGPRRPRPRADGPGADAAGRPYPRAPYRELPRPR